MRCTRCDRIALPQVLGRKQDGHLVFGWCRACLVEEGCEVVDEPPVDLRLRVRLSPRLRWRRACRVAKRLRRVPSGQRQLGLVVTACLMAAWALVLTAVGTLRLPR